MLLLFWMIKMEKMGKNDINNVWKYYHYGATYMIIISVVWGGQINLVN